MKKILTPSPHTPPFSMSASTPSPLNIPSLRSEAGGVDERRLVRVARSNGKRRKHKMKKKSAYSHKGLLTEIFRKEAESQNNRKPKCYNNAAMKYTPEIEKLIEEAKMAVEESRSVYGYGSDDPSDIQPPTWLAELEAAVEAVENAQ